MSTKESRRSAREKLAEERRQQALADARKRRMWNIVIAIVVVVVVVGLGALVLAKNNSAPSTAKALPATVTDQGGGVTAGKDTAPVTLNLWEDFQCPICKQFESVNAAQIATMTDAGAIKVIYHPLSFLDNNFNNDASVLAANAFGCSATYGLQQKYHNTIFANQPPREGTGYTNDQLIQWGKDIGITSSDFASCVNGGTYNDWVSQVESSGTTNGITGTPTIFINGVEYSSSKNKGQYGAFLTDPKALSDAIAAAASGSASPSPSGS
jgi:protein-disulfide isomerase